MKGRKLSYEDCMLLPENTKVILEYPEENVVAEIKHNDFEDIDGDIIEKINNNIAFKFIEKTLAGATWTYGHNSVYEYIEDAEDRKKEKILSRVYKGWEILKLIDENRLLQKTKLISDTDIEYEIIEFNGYLCIGGKDNEGNIDFPTSPGLQARTFKIVKEYMTFDEARKLAMKEPSYCRFKHKEMSKFYNIYNVLDWLKTNRNQKCINKMLDEKLWEVEI